MDDVVERAAVREDGNALDRLPEEAVDAWLCLLAGLDQPRELRPRGCGRST
ncbi:hypothetical protein [Streptacidiphilus cavernicola]|uniref:Uncharacterized protein n=1 Tax=Streptacidiphilus cavernicola TaxID=3342716 RepID=A0ABV6W264_9ACTN